MNTKELIIDEALTLFASNGYEGTSVKDIANAVGIKDSSLYKHFHNKKDIFDTIVQGMCNKMENMSLQIGMPEGDDFTKTASYYGKLTIEDLVTLSRQIFLFYLRDPFVARFRRMATIEQYRDREVYNVYHHIFIEDSITYQCKLFSEMIKQNIILNVNPRLLAINYYAPIFFLISKYDNEPDKDTEALEILDDQVREFCRLYKAGS